MQSPVAGRKSVVKRCATIAFLAAGVCLPGSGAHGQDVPAGGRSVATARGQVERVEGRVVSAATGRPLALAQVEIPGMRRSATTDAEGRFRLFRVPAGEHAVQVQLIGYQARSVTVAAGEEVTVKLDEDPVMLSAITVTVNRFDRRLKAVPTAVRVLGPQEIASSTVTDARELVLRQTGMIAAPCRSVETTPPCFVVRGSVTRPQVFLDDAPAPAGMDALAALSRDALSRIEIIRDGAVINAYTDQFVEWAARNRYRPLPLTVLALY